MKASNNQPPSDAREAFEAWYPDGCAVKGAAAKLAAQQAFKAGAAWQAASTQGFTAHDMATAAADGFRDGVASTQASEPSAAPFIHKKTGGKYQFVGNAQLQTSSPLNDMAYVVVYRGEDGKLWVRPSDEFTERFYQEGRPRILNDDFLAAEDEALNATGGVLVAGALIAAPARAVEPLTEAQKDELWYRAHRDESRRAAFVWYFKGIADAERAHGITTTPTAKAGKGGE